MLPNDRSIKLIRLVLPLLFVLCAITLSPCGGSEQDGDPTVTILWNRTTGTYLYRNEVENAPSGELRRKDSGEYLDKESWKKKRS